MLGDSQPKTNTQNQTQKVHEKTSREQRLMIKQQPIWILFKFKILLPYELCNFIKNNHNLLLTLAVIIH